MYTAGTFTFEAGAAREASEARWGRWSRPVGGLVAYALITVLVTVWRPS